VEIPSLLSEVFFWIEIAAIFRLNYGKCHQLQMKAHHLSSDFLIYFFNKNSVSVRMKLTTYLCDFGQIEFFSFIIFYFFYYFVSLFYTRPRPCVEHTCVFNCSLCVVLYMSTFL